MSKEVVKNYDIEYIINIYIYIIFMRAREFLCKGVVPRVFLVSFCVRPFAKGEGGPPVNNILIILKDFSRDTHRCKDNKPIIAKERKEEIESQREKEREREED